MKLLIKAEVVRKDQLTGIDAAVRRQATNLLSWIGVLGETGSDNEFNMITRMDHPSIVKALDYSEKSIWLENSGAVFDPQKFSPDEILGVYCQVFSAVKHVTSSETYHNNVGESNITVDKHGRATLLDFNVATDMRADATKHPFSNYISLLKSFRSSVQKFDHPPSQETRALVEKILDSIPKLEDPELTSQRAADVMSGVNADFPPLMQILTPLPENGSQGFLRPICPRHQRMNQILPSSVTFRRSKDVLISATQYIANAELFCWR